MYFPLALVYKLFGKYEQIENSYTDEYWINSYWFVTAIYFMLIFTNLITLCRRDIYLHADFYKRIIRAVAIYWGVMATLRLYLFFNIELYKKIISSANTVTVGGVTIVLLLTYLTARKNVSKSESKD